MSDAAVTTLVFGLVQVTVIVVGFLTLWVKLKYDVKQAKESAIKTAEKVGVVESKINSNTATTEDVNRKADTILEQTNGGLEKMRLLVGKIAERVDKLEDYNHESSHRLFDAINTVHLKLVAMSVMYDRSTTALTSDLKEQK